MTLTGTASRFTIDRGGLLTLAPTGLTPDGYEWPPITTSQDTPTKRAPATARTPITVRFPLWLGVALLCMPAFVAIWSGWIGLGQMTGFGAFTPFVGIPYLDRIAINSCVTLPIGMEAYAAVALGVWLPGTHARAEAFARRTALTALIVGGAGQVAYHLMAAAGIHHAPWEITTVVSVIPLGVAGMGASLTHMLRAEARTEKDNPPSTDVPTPGTVRPNVHAPSPGPAPVVPDVHTDPPEPSVPDETAPPRAPLPPTTVTPTPEIQRPAGPRRRPLPVTTSGGETADQVINRLAAGGSGRPAIRKALAGRGLTASDRTIAAAIAAHRPPKETS
jgi:hypothetical protein